MNSAIGTSVRLSQSSRHALIVSGLIASAALLNACEQRQETSLTGPSPRSASKVAIPLPKLVRSSEEGFAALARAIPSSAGFYYDQNDKLVVWVSDSAEMIRAVAAVQALVGSRAIELSPEKSRVPQVLVRVGSYSFRELAAWRDSVSTYFDNTKDAGIVSLDLDEAANRVGVGVLNQSLEPQLLSRFAQMGINPAAISFRVSEPMKLDVGHAATKLESFSNTPVARTTRFTTLDIRNSQSTMIGGLQIGVRINNGGGAHGICTLGFVVQHTQSNVTKNGIVTASHCTENVFGADHDTVTQEDSGAVIGRELHDPDDYTCGIWQCRPSDVAFVETNSGVALALGQIARWPGVPYNLFSYDPANNWVVTEAGNQGIYVGTYTDWVGTTSGAATGRRVTNTCMDLLVDSNHKVTCGMVDTIASMNGDSGGPVWIELGRGNEVRAVGTVSGHPDAYHMVWSQVDRALSDFSGEGATLVFNPSSISAPTVTQSINGSGHPVISWTSVSGALAYEIYRDTYDFDCTKSTSGTGYLGYTTVTSFTDEAESVTNTGNGLCPYIEYHVTVSTASGFSGSSNRVYFY